MKPQPTRTDRILAVVATLALVFISGSFVTGFYMMWWPFEPLTKFEMHIHQETSDLRPGGHLTVTLDYCKSEDWAANDKRRALVDEVLIVLPSQNVPLTRGCRQKDVVFDLSPHVIPGRYQLQAQIVYTPWPWRSFVYDRRSPSFVLE